MGRFIGKFFVEHQREFVEHFPYGKQIGKILDIRNTQKRPQTQKPILLGLESEKSEIYIILLNKLKIYEICSRNFCAEWL